MTDCGWLSDRMPAVALGQAQWTSDESRHLGGCSSCQDEWKVVQATVRLGQDVVHSHDPGITANAVLRRLQNPVASRNRRPAWTLAGLAAAAAIAAIVWSAPLGNRPRPVTETPLVAGGLQIPLPELESLQPAELDSVFQTMDEPAAGGSSIEDPSLGDLDADELQRVLETWEG